MLNSARRWWPAVWHPWGTIALFVLLAAGWCAPLARAEDYPTKTITIIVPYTPGGSTEILARIVGQKLEERLGKSVIIENKPGAGGNTGADAVAKSAPDGYTLLMSSAGILTANPFLYAKMPFDAETAFIPVSNVADMSMLVVVNPKVEAKTLGDLVAFARANPGKLNFGSPGIGTTGHLGLAMLMHAANIKVTHVPYRGAAPAVTDLIAGQIDGVVDNPPTVLPHINAGKLRPLAVAAKSRMALLPDVPTAAEAGLANYEASSWFGIAAPAGTPPEVVAILNKHVNTVISEPDFKAKLLALGTLAYAGKPEELARQLDSDIAKWRDVIEKAGIQKQ